MSHRSLLLSAIAIAAGCASLPVGSTLRPELQTAFEEMDELARTLNVADTSIADEAKRAMSTNRELLHRMKTFAYMLNEADRQNHADPRTTAVYDRSDDNETLEDVELVQF